MLKLEPDFSALWKNSLHGVTWRGQSGRIAAKSGHSNIMHPRIYQEFERICADRSIRGSVLEVGAVPSDQSLLCMKSLEQASEKIGIDLDGPHEYKGIKIVKGNANAMDCFPDKRFDTVICNATLEHDKYFWKTLAEIKRVAKPGALVVIGVPGFAKFRAEKFSAILSRTPILRRLHSHPYLNMLFTGTVTFQVHNWPGDYYRFSPQAVREVFLEGLEEVEVHSIMAPPRLFGIGLKPANS
jgi:SAM-dependent methyltransferase